MNDWTVHRRSHDMDDAQERREVDDLLRVTWPQLYCLEGDTMVFLDYPSFGARNCQDIPWSSARFRMDSQKLLATGSSEITRLLSEDKQRRLRLQHRSEKLPSDIRYILDLTPETEGDHIASLLGSLSLPRGVRDWWMAKDRFGVSQWFVSGHDDWCHNHADIPLDCKKPDSVTLPLVRSAIEDARKYKILLGPEVIADCPVREIAEYCEIRHRANIVRLLLAVAGYDLVLNSAPRVYAIVMLAEDLDLVNVISSPVRAWFEDHRNSSFIDVHPELALEMGWRLQLSDLVRAPLRIVVMERALEPGEAPLSGTTIFGRPRISLSDDISTVVQHSTNAMRVRVKDTADHLFSAKAYNWLKIESWDTMIQLGDLLDTEISATHLEREQLPSWAQNLLAQCHRIIVSLVNYITNIADEAAKEVPVGSRQYEIDNDRLAYIPAGAKVTFCGNIISSFSREQVLMTPFFWQKLVNETESREQFLGQPIYSGDLLCKKLGEDMEDFNDRVNAAMSRGLLPRVAAWFPGGVSVDPIRFHVQLWKAVSKAQQDWCPSTHALEFALHRTTHLALGFTEDEFRFLPLWAGGLDDETGAVFEDMTVPDTDMGPCQPGPTFVTGKTIAPSTTADSDTTIIGLGQSVQAAQSGTDTGASGSKRTDSFVDVSAPVSDFDLDDFDMVYGDTVSLEEAMEDIGLCSDSSKDGDAEYASQSVDNEDIESMTAEPGDVAFDEDYMRSDDDWSDLPSSSAL